MVRKGTLRTPLLYGTRLTPRYDEEQKTYHPLKLLEFQGLSQMHASNRGKSVKFTDFLALFGCGDYRGKQENSRNSLIYNRLAYSWGVKFSDKMQVKLTTFTSDLQHSSYLPLSVLQKLSRFLDDHAPQSP